MKLDGAAGSGNAAQRWLLPLIIWLFPVVAIGFGVQTWLPKLASEHGAGIDLVLNYLLWTVGSILIIGHIVLGYFIWRFSRQDRVTHRESAPRVERKWALIPILTMALVAEGGVLVLGMPVWSKYFASAAPENAVTVEVTGEQFAWNIRYPGEDGKFGRTDPNLIDLDNPLGMDESDPVGQDDMVLINEIHLPVNMPARIRLRSKDTLHSFYLPHQRVKQDAVPGMVIEVWFIPTLSGDYEIACAELCGFGHYEMRGLLRVTPKEAFEKWRSEEPAYF